MEVLLNSTFQIAHAQFLNMNIIIATYLLQIHINNNWTIRDG